MDSTEITTALQGENPLIPSLDAIPLAILFVDRTLKIRWVNEKAALLFTRQRESLIGESIDPAQGGLWTWSDGLSGTLRTRFRAGDPIREEDQHLSILKDGARSLHHLRITTSQVPFAGDQMMLLVLKEITGPKGVEKENIDTEALRLTVQMVRTTAHELSQPLSVLVGNLELLKKQLAVDDALTSRIEKISESADRVAEIVQRLQTAIHAYRTSDLPKVSTANLTKTSSITSGISRP